MSNYQVGDKFVIEIEEVYNNTFSEKTALHRIKGFNSLVFDKNGLDKLERLDGDYVNENFGELQDEAYKEGEKAAIRAEMVSEVLTAKYEQGLNDAWELARRIALLNGDNIFSDNELKTIFGTTEYDEVLKIPVEDALTKLEAYEKEHAEIKVGDVVKHERDEVEVLVTCVHSDNTFDGIKITTDDELGKLGGTYSGRLIKSFHKTGKHIDISAILAEIGNE